MQNTACQFNIKRSQYLNVIKRFLQSDQPLLLIIGESGCGKTRILDDITLQIRSTRPVLRLLADTNLSPSQFTQTLAQHWNIQTTRNHPKLESQLDELIAGLSNQKQSYVLIIDNAHFMTLSVLAAISYLTLKQQEKQQTQLHLLIAGHPILTEKFNCLQTKTAPEITLGTLSREAAFREIHRLFDKADLQLPHVAANAMFIKIFQQSKGLPKTLENMVQKLVSPRIVVNSSDTTSNTPVSFPALPHSGKCSLTAQQGKKLSWKKVMCLMSLTVFSLSLTWAWQKKHPSLHQTLPYTHSASSVKKNYSNSRHIPAERVSLFPVKPSTLQASNQPLRKNLTLLIQTR